MYFDKTHFYYTIYVLLLRWVETGLNFIHIFMKTKLENFIIKKLWSEYEKNSLQTVKNAKKNLKNVQKNVVDQKY